MLGYDRTLTYYCYLLLGGHLSISDYQRQGKPVGYQCNHFQVTKVGVHPATSQHLLVLNQWFREIAYPGPQLEIC